MIACRPGGSQQILQTVLIQRRVHDHTEVDNGRQVSGVLVIRGVFKIRSKEGSENLGPR